MIYFDNAATSWPKPRGVAAAITKCLESYCGNPGRGGHRMAMAAATKIYECRERICELFGSDQPESVAFFENDTAALNIAIKCAMAGGGNILISDAEHNSVRRPALAMKKAGCGVGVYRAFRGAATVISDISAMIDLDTKAVVAIHRSNICPLELPIKEIGGLCRKRGIFFIVDAAQSAGGCKIDVRDCNIDALCAPGHKGLLGPQGTGIMVSGERFRNFLVTSPTLFDGGSGINSREPAMPSVYPERFEAGTQNTPGIAGLAEGIRFINEYGEEMIEKKENMLYARVREILMNTRRVKLYMSEYERGSILLFNIDGVSPEKVASEFDKYGICMRAGLHCAPSAHEALGTGKEGAVRLGLGVFNTFDEIEKFARVLRRVINENGGS